MILQFIIKRKKKLHEIRSTNLSKIAKNRFPTRHRQIRIFGPKNQILKSDNNTKRYQDGFIFLIGFNWSIFEDFEKSSKKFKLRKFL